MVKEKATQLLFLPQDEAGPLTHHRTGAAEETRSEEHGGRKVHCSGGDRALELPVNLGNRNAPFDDPSTQEFGAWAR